MKKILLSLLAVALLLTFSSHSSAVAPEELLFDFGDMDWDEGMVEDYPALERYGPDQAPVGFGSTMVPDPAKFSGLVIAMIVFMLALFMALYVYFALAYSAIAKKTGTKRPWLAWIPVANLYLQSQIAQMRGWPVLMAVPPFLGLLGMIFSLPLLGVVMLFLSLVSLPILMVFSFFWQYRIFGRLGHPGWWALTYLVGTFTGMIIFCIFLGMAAWPKQKAVVEAPPMGVINQ